MGKGHLVYLVIMEDELNRQNKPTEDNWQVVKGRVIAGILCEVSADGQRLRFKKGRRVEIVCITGETLTTTGDPLTPSKPGIQ